MKLNLGCSDDIKAGWVNVDRALPDSVKTSVASYDRSRYQQIVWQVGPSTMFHLFDLNNHPWPYEDSSIDKIYAHDVFEHLHCFQPGNGGKIICMNEAWRVLKPGGILDIAVPCAYAEWNGLKQLNPGAFADPTHCTFWTWDDQFFFSQQFNHPLGERGRLGPGYGITALFEFPVVEEIQTKQGKVWRTVDGAEGGIAWQVNTYADRAKIVGLLRAVK